MRKLFKQYETFIIVIASLYCAEVTSTTTIFPVNDIETIQNRIVNRHDFEFVLNPAFRICKSDQVFMLVYVHTAPGNLKRRLSIRETWARRSMFRDLRLVFMMGSVNDKKIAERVLLENAIYQDIVQENFLDSYKNLTYKGIVKKSRVLTK